MISSLKVLLSSIRIADFLDMAIITVLLYFILIWRKRRASRSVIIGFAVVLSVFSLARFLNMYMTSMLFHAGITAALIGLVLIFQDDIRTAIERLSSIGSLKSKHRVLSSNKTLEILVESIKSMASEKIGALIVLKGRDSLERHLSGGISLNGRISTSLLYSIFHPSTPNHDGAVIVEGERIDKFGVRLPLSLNDSEVGQNGTRHTAALGISERSDACTIAVSEERGTITLAQRGKLEIVSPTGLQRKLELFYSNAFPSRSGGKTRKLPFRNPGIKLTAALISFVIWFIFAFKTDTVNRTFTIPVVYKNIPPNWVIEEPKITEVKVSLTGSERMFLFDQSALAARIDVSKLNEGKQTLIVGDKDIDVPSGVSISQISPRTFTITAQKTVPTPIPVKVRREGRLNPNLILEKIEV
ncbi:MAG: diadenylate cyclase, partial [Fibrobacterota bacterium]